MNKTLADTAVNGVTDRAFEAGKGYCQRFLRQCLQACSGSRYDAYMLGTAAASGRAFAHAGLALVPSAARPLQPGDILYKTYFDPGHVGLYVGDDKVAENSSTHLGRIQGAKGYRTLDEFGHFDLVVRLPDPHPAAPLAPAQHPAPAAAPQAAPDLAPLNVTVSGVKYFSADHQHDWDRLDVPGVTVTVGYHKPTGRLVITEIDTNRPGG